METAVVTCSVAPMRAAPSGNAEMVSQARFGETVAVLRRAEAWAEARTPDGYMGWVASAALAAPAQSVYAAGERGAEVTVPWAPLRAAPGADAPQRTLITLGARVEIDEEEGAWARVRTPAGGLAFVASAHLRRPAGAPTAGERLPAPAGALIGVPYLWGGRTPFGFDCSGFVQLLYALGGYRLPRDAHLQAADETLAEVARGNLRPGDLVFFAGARDPRRRGVTHVGMALGDGRFVHASSLRGVAVSELDEEPYAREYHVARGPRA